MDVIDALGGSGFAPVAAGIFGEDRTIGEYVSDFTSNYPALLDETINKINIYELVAILADSNYGTNKTGEYSDIKKVLDYLILELGLPTKNIEKCPSILYFNVNAVRTNYEFLSSTGITMDNVNNCLHILSTNPNDLRENARAFDEAMEEWKKLSYEKNNFNVNARAESLTVNEIMKLFKVVINT